MSVAELKKAIAGISDDALVLVSDLDGNMVAVSGVEESYKSEGVVALCVEHFFPEEWFVEGEDGTRYDTI